MRAAIHPRELFLFVISFDELPDDRHVSRIVVVNFDVIALTVLCLIWAGFGVIPWLVVAYRRKGRGTLALLPLAIIGGVGGAVLVPALGARNLPAVLGSFAAAMAGSLILIFGVPYVARVVRRRGMAS